jgi:hypothetical protein
MLKQICLASLLICTLVFAADPPIDWNRARDLHQREQRGEKLSPEDQAYLDRAKTQRRNQNANQQRPPLPPPKESTGLVPISNKSDATYKGFTLGLYGESQNSPPADHLKRATEAAAKVIPLDAEGHSAPDGRIVLMSVGMSNTTQEFSRFVQIANADESRNPKLVIVDAAQGGKAADDWVDPANPTWKQADARLAGAHVTPKQVQVLWIKQARKGPTSLGEFPKHAQALEEDLKKIVAVAHDRLPNLRLIYLSSRTYAGYATTALNPEPYAYESAFSVQWLIRAQIKNEDPALAYDKAPVLLWGPYLWTDGTKGREQDKLVWNKEDTANDGTHPSATGQRKVAEQLLAFFKSDPTAKSWFCR